MYGGGSTAVKVTLSAENSYMNKYYIRPKQIYRHTIALRLNGGMNIPAHEKIRK